MTFGPMTVAGMDRLHCSRSFDDMAEFRDGDVVLTEEQYRGLMGQVCIFSCFCSYFFCFFCKV